MQLADAFLLVYKAAKRAVHPRAQLAVSEWADNHRVLSAEGSAESGPWRTNRNPPMKKIMDSLSEHHKTPKVVFMKPSQWGGTEIGVNWLGYIMAHAKGPTALVMPTEKSLQDWVIQKFDPMAEDTQAVADALNKRSNKSADNSAQRKKFTGGIIYFKTAGSTSDLKASSLRYAVGDEIDEWPRETNQGSALRLLEIRLTAFYDGKLYLVSSPTIKDASSIDEEYQGGNQQQYHVACPHCGERQILKWSNLRWESAPDNKKEILRLFYVCMHHGCVIEEYEKTNMLRDGEWVANAPTHRYDSYHINALYSPIGLGLSWLELVYEWLDAQDDPRKLMVFLNTRMAETYADRRHDIKANALMARAEPYQLRTIPLDVGILTAGVDVQDDRLEIKIKGHARGDVRYTIDYHVLYGNPAGDEIWQALADYLKNAKFPHPANGVMLRLEATAVDIGGHHTQQVYRFVRNSREFGLVRVMAVKGASTAGRPILGRPSYQDVDWRGERIKKGVALYLIGTDTAKHLLYNRLQGDADKDAGSRLERFSQELDSAYFDGLVAETFNPRKNKFELKKGKRNEQLDCDVYSVAASHHPELHLHKWRDADWDRRMSMLRPKKAAKKPLSEANSTDFTSEKPITEPVKKTKGRKKMRVVKR